MMSESNKTREEILDHDHEEDSEAAEDAEAEVCQPKTQEEATERI